MIGTTLTALLTILVNSGELTPNITRNQIQPTWYSHGGYYGQSVETGSWSDQPDESHVAILNDLRRFGLDRVAIEASFEIANRQSDRSDEIRSWNQEWVFFNWEREIRHKTSAWRCLAYAASPDQSLRNRLMWLDRLIDEIGIEDYTGGIMPTPAPFYKNGGQ